MKPKVLIVGGGPAGAACGIELARQGNEVSLLERGVPYRDKVCGDGLAFDTQRALKHLDMLETTQKKARLVTGTNIYGYRGEKIILNTAFLTLQRSEFDQILRDRVEKLKGRVVYESRVESVETTPKGVVVRDHQDRAYEGDILVLATGVRTNLAESLGFNFRFRTAVALRGYVPNTQNLNTYSFWMSKDLIPGYAWAFPCPDQTLNIGVIYFESNKPYQNLHELLQTLLGKFSGPPLNFLQRPKGFQLRTGLKRDRNYADRVLLVGENIDCTYDLSGEGIGKAMESGILAARTIARAAPPYDSRYLAPYQESVSSSSARFHGGYTKAMRLMANPIGNYVFTRILSRSKRASQALTSIIKEEKYPQELFSFGGMLKHLISS